MNYTDYVHEVDAEDRIRMVGPSWLEFARENSAPELTETAVTGRSLFDFIAGEVPKRLYHLLLDRVRRTRQRIRFPFRCDGPRVRRFMEMHITPLPGGRVRFTGRLLCEERREHIPIFDPVFPRSGDTLRVCAWCKKVGVDEGRWLEVEDAIAQMGLFETRQMPSILHAVCGDCEQQIRETAAAPDPFPS